MNAVTPPVPAGSPPTGRTSSTTGRLVAVGMLLAVVVAGAVIAFVVIAMSSSDDASSSSGWDTVAALDYRTGEITLFDADGERIDRISTDIDEPRAHVISDSHLVVEGFRSDRRTIAIVDVSAGEILDFDVDDDIAPGDSRSLVVRPIRNADAFVVGSEGERGTAYLMTPAGEIVDIALEARWDEPFISSFAASATPDGSAVAFVDLASVDAETAIVSLADLDVTVVDGALASLSNDRVRTTSERSLDGFELETFDLTGQQLDSFEVEPFRIGIDTSEGDFIIGSIDGEVIRYTAGGESERLAEFSVGDGSEFVPAVRTDGPDTALALAAFDGEVLVVGPDGNVIDGIELGARVSRFDVSGRCIPVVTESSVAIIEAATGEVLANERIGEGRPPLVFAADDDACTVYVGSDEQSLIGQDEVVEIDTPGSLAGLSGDGTAYATADADRNITVHGLGDEAFEDVELDGNDVISVHFLRR